MTPIDPLLYKTIFVSQQVASCSDHGLVGMKWRSEYELYRQNRNLVVEAQKWVDYRVIVVYLATIRRPEMRWGGVYVCSCNDWHWRSQPCTEKQGCKAKYRGMGIRGIGASSSFLGHVININNFSCQNFRTIQILERIRILAFELHCDLYINSNRWCRNTLQLSWLLRISLASKFKSSKKQHFAIHDIAQHSQP